MNKTQEYQKQFRMYLLDDHILCKELARLFNKDILNCEQFLDGKELLAAVERKRPDLIIARLILTSADHTVRQIKSGQAHTIPIIVITTGGVWETNYAYSLGADIVGPPIDVVKKLPKFLEFIAKPRKYNFESEFEELPAIMACKGLWQNQHHAFTVYDHTLNVVRLLKLHSDDSNIIAAGYLHDIGKPVTAKPIATPKDEELKGKKYHRFSRHAEKSAELLREMTDEIFIKYGLDKQYITGLVEIHDMPLQKIRNLRKAKDLDEFVDQFYELKDRVYQATVSPEDIIMFLRADTLGKGPGKDHMEILFICNALAGGKQNLRDIYEMQRKQ